VVLYEYALRLCGEKSLTISPRTNRLEFIQAIAKVVQHFREKVSRGTFSTDRFFWKNDLSIMMLLPSYLLQAKGFFVYKKLSFVEVKRQFTQLDFSVMDEATEEMKQWQTTHLLRFYPDFLIRRFPFISQKIIGMTRRLARWESISRIEQKKREAMCRDFLFLAERALSAVLETYDYKR
jgi:hypothetical protein